MSNNLCNVGLLAFFAVISLFYLAVFYRFVSYIIVQYAGRSVSSAVNLVHVLFCSSAVLDPRGGHTMDVLSPFISVLCHSD